MNFIYLTFINIKRYFRNPILIIVTFIIPVFMMFSFNMESETTVYSVGIVDEDKTSSSKSLIDEIEKVYDIKMCKAPLEHDISSLKEKKLGALIIIEKGFENEIKNGNMPIIKEYKTKEINGALTLEDIINSFIKGEEKNINLEVKSDIENSKDNSGKELVNFFCYIILIMSAFITEDMIKMKKSKVIKRNISTVNSDKEILASILFASFILDVTSITVSLIMGKTVFHMSEIPMWKGMLSIILMEFFSISLSMAVSRWINNCGLGSIITLIIGLLSLALGMTGTVGETYISFPEVFLTFQVISPIYWVNEIVSGGMILKGVLIIFLMSLVLFTFGGFKLKDFIDE